MEPDFASIGCIVDHVEREINTQQCNGYVIRKVENRSYGNLMTYYATVTELGMAKNVIRLCVGDDSEFDQENLEFLFENWEGGSIVCWSNDGQTSVEAKPVVLKLKMEWRE